MVARFDKSTDPWLREQLLLSRRGQAYFSRKVNELSDADLDGDSLLAGWNRRHVIAHVGLNARALTRLIEWAATGVETPMYASTTQRDEEIAMAATLPDRALRNLSDHAAIHLNVEWRDLEPENWSHLVRTIQGRTVPASETIWMRMREVWIHSVDLANGGTFDHFPPQVIDSIIADVLSAWRRRREAEGLPVVVLEPTDRPTPFGAEDLGTAVAAAATTGTIVLRGRASQLASWATGRGAVGVVSADGREVPPPPRWL